MLIIRKFASFFEQAVRSRLACVLISLHTAWFFLAIANMSPPSAGLTKYLDQGGWSSATLFAGRPFHFTYESIVLKSLVLVDLPAMLAELPIGLPLSPLVSTLHLGSYSRSYLEAGLLLLLATCQWLVVGRLVESRIGSTKSGAQLLSRLRRYWMIAVACIVILTAIAVPIVNQRSRALGFRHGAISFH